MGGASASAVPAASSAGGYASKGAMSAATIGGTTGGNVSGMGWVPRAQAASGGTNYMELAKFFGGALKDSSGQFGKAVAGQQYGTGGYPAASFSSPDASAFQPGSFGMDAGSLFQPRSFSLPSLGPGLPQARSTSSRVASAAGGPLRQTGLGYTV